MIRRKQPSSYSYEEVKAAVAPDQNGANDFDRDSTGKRFALKKIRLDRIPVRNYEGSTPNGWVPVVTEHTAEIARNLDPMVDGSQATYMQDLIQAIRSRVQIPPMVVQDHVGFFELLDGDHRVRAYAGLSRVNIKAYVRLSI